MINRKLYKDIKKYDHKQMNDFLTRLYQNGYNDAIKKLSEERTQPDPEEIKAKLLTIKGVGIVKAQQIMDVLGVGVADL